MNNIRQRYKYFAFISYNSKDRDKAKWLRSCIESYKLPTVYRKKSPMPNDFREFLDAKHKTFLDTENLGIGPLPQELKDCLDNSRYLIVVCSPNSAKPCWVDEEIKYFRQSHPVENIILLIIDGEPHSKELDLECFNQAILNIPKDTELIAANILTSGEKKAFVQIMAYMLGQTFDEFYDIYRRSIIRKRIFKGILAFTFLLFALLSVYLLVPRNLALRLTEIEKSNLKFRGSTISLYYYPDKQTAKSYFMQKLENEIIFKDIPAYKWLGKGRIMFESYGYYKIDTIVPFAKTVDLTIQRDDTFGLIAGIVTDVDTHEPIENVLINILDEKSYTDSLGNFRMKIPIEKQVEEYDVTIYKSGYIPYLRPKVSPESDWKIHLTKLNK